MENHAIWKRSAVSALSFALLLATTPPVGAVGVHGTLRASGTAWVSDGSSEWAEIASTRPLLAGDRVKTGTDGHLVADMGARGTVGMFAGAEVSANEAGDVVDVHSGKVAFQIRDGLAIHASDALVSADETAVGYVEMMGASPSLVAEQGTLTVAMAGTERTINAGQRMNLESGKIDSIQLAGAYGQPEQEEELPVPPPPPPPAAPVVTSAAAPAAGGGLSIAQILGWTALAAVVGVVIYEIADDDDDDRKATDDGS